MQAIGTAAYAAYEFLQTMVDALGSPENRTVDGHPLPPGFGAVSFEGGEFLTTEKYIELVASGKIEKNPHQDFYLLGIVPDATKDPVAVQLIALDLLAQAQLPALEFLLERCGRLTSLPIHIADMSMEDSIRFSQILRRTQPDIRFLDGKSVELADREAFCKFQNILESCKNLNRLRLHSVSWEALPEFARAIPSLPQLEWLQINIVEHDIDDDDDFLPVLNALSAASSLKALGLPDLEANETTGAAVLDLLQGMNAKNRLTGLELGIDDFERPGLFPAFCTLIRKLAAIEFLELKSHCDWLEDGDGQKFARAVECHLQQNASLKQLFLDCSGLLPEIPAVCESLRNSPAPLTQIHLELPSHFWKIPRATLEALVETARRRPGLLSIRVKDMNERDLRREFERSKTHDDFHTDYQTPGEPLIFETVSARFVEAAATLTDLLARNNALHKGAAVGKHATVLVTDPASTPDSSLLDPDSSHLVIEHLLAHSASVQQFEQVMAHIEYTLAAKKFVAEEQAPTSTASSSSTTTTTSGTLG